MAHQGGAEEDEAKGKEEENDGNTSYDDEGIANFLTDEIGSDVEADLLKDITDSSALAELLEVVKSSLASASADINNVAPHSEQVSSFVCGEWTEQVKDEANNSPSKKENVHKSRNKHEQDESSVLQRLKVRLKETKEVKVKSKDKRKAEKQKQEASSIQKTISSTKNGRRDENIALHKKCIKQHKKSKYKHKCDPCCVVLYDVLRTDKFFEYIIPVQVAKSSVSSLSLCCITETKISALHNLERTYRSFYGAGVKHCDKGANSKAEKGFPWKTVAQVSTSKKAKVEKPDKIKKGTKVILADGEMSLGKKRMEVDLDKDETLASECDNKKKVTKTDSLAHSEPVEEGLSEEDNTMTGRENRQEGRERLREKNDSKREKDKRFEKLERERSRKFSDTKKQFSTIEQGPHNSCLPLPSTKNLDVNFRIPKTEDRGKKEKPTITSRLDSIQDKRERKVSELESQPEKPQDGRIVDSVKNKQALANPEHGHAATPTSLTVETSHAEFADTIETHSVEGQEEELRKPCEEQTATIEPAEAETDKASADSDAGITLPPLSEAGIRMGEFAMAVTQLMKENKDRAPTFQTFSNSCDPVTEKCAWWFSMCDKQLLTFESKFTVLESPPSSVTSDAGSDISYLGNVSNPGDQDKCQVNEISSTSRKYDCGPVSVRDPDEVDEYCGRSLLHAKIRTACGGEKFKNLFDVRRGAVYEKENFQAKCNICNELIVGKRELARHVRAVTHKAGLRNLDPYMESQALLQTSGTNAESSPKKKDNKKKELSQDSKSPTKPATESRAKIELKDKRIQMESGMKVEYGTTSTGLQVKVPLEDGAKVKNASTNSSEKEKRSPEKVKRRHSKSRSHSRERRPRSRSRSPVRIVRSPLRNRHSRSRSPECSSRRRTRRSRSTSRSRAFRRRKSSRSDEHRGRRNFSRKKSRSHSPVILKKDNREFNERLMLVAEGKWTDVMESQWKLMEAEESTVLQQFTDLKKQYNVAPEDHPRYGDEWTAFWERRYQELEREGKDAENYDFVPEWKEVWTKRLNQLLQEEAEEKIREVKKKYGMDCESLYRVRQVSKLTANGINDAGSSMATVTKQSTSRGPGIVEISSIPSAHIIPKKAGTAGLPEPGSSKSSVSVKQFMSTWTTLTTTGETQTTASKDQETLVVPEYSVTTPFNQSELAKSGISIAAAASDITTSSSEGLDFLGFDLVQVLRLMTNLDDQLSFLAPKVCEYYKIAEEMELKKRKGSMDLLNQEELVTIMFQARDRFMTMIRSNVLSREILQRLNLTVYALNAILDAPECQKFRPKVAPPLPDAIDIDDTTKADVQKSAIKVEPSAQNQAGSKNVLSLAEEQEFDQLMDSLPSSSKNAMAGEVTKYLLLMGGQDLQGKPLKAFLAKIFTPLIRKYREREERSQELNRVHGARINPEPAVVGHVYGYSHSSDVGVRGVSGSKAVGSAVPKLPNVHVGAGPPVSGASGPPNHENLDAYASSSGWNNREGEDGRRSPFSRRTLAMNPVSNRPSPWHQ